MNVDSNLIDCMQHIGNVTPTTLNKIQTLIDNQGEINDKLVSQEQVSTLLRVSRHTTHPIKLILYELCLGAIIQYLFAIHLSPCCDEKWMLHVYPLLS